MSDEQGTWRRISCERADALRHPPDIVPGAARTDLYGEFGEPEVYTLWVHRATETWLLKEHRYPQIPEASDPNPPDRKPCEHYEWRSNHLSAVPNPTATPWDGGEARDLDRALKAREEEGEG